MIDIDINSIEQEFYSEYQQENMTSRVDRENNFLELIFKLPPRESKLLKAIKNHLNNLRNPSDELIEKFYVNKSHAKEVLTSNTLDITPNFIYYYQVIKLEDYSSKKNANYKARSLCKALVKEGVLYKLNSRECKDRYLINPLYIYYSSRITSDNFGSIYLQWCECNGISLSPEDKYLKSVYKRRSKTNGKVSVISNPLEVSNRVDDYTQALQDVKQEQQQRTIEQEQQYQLSLANNELAIFKGKDPQRWIDTFTRRNIPFNLLPDHIKPYIHISSPTEAEVLGW